MKTKANRHRPTLRSGTRPSNFFSFIDAPAVAAVYLRAIISPRFMTADLAREPYPHRPQSRALGVAFGASFLGFATHAGFLRCLLSHYWKPAAVAGSSAGALIAGLYAAGIGIDQIEAVVTRSDLRRLLRERIWPLRALGMFLGRPGITALLAGVHLRPILIELLGDLRIEDCREARLHIAVTNFGTNCVELRDRGPLVDTILASCALPGLLPPRRIDGDLLWDGGLGSCVPVEQWIDDSAIDRILTHSLLHEELLRTRARPERLTFAGAMMAGHQLTADELLRWKLELARRAGKSVVAIETVTPRPRLGPPLSPPTRKSWPETARELMTLGERSALRAIDALTAAETPAANC